MLVRKAAVALARRHLLLQAPEKYPMAPARAPSKSTRPYDIVTAMTAVTCTKPPYIANATPSPTSMACNNPTVHEAILIPAAATAIVSPSPLSIALRDRAGSDATSDLLLLSDPPDGWRDAPDGWPAIWASGARVLWPFFFEPMYREAAVLLLPPIWRCAFEVEISMYGKRKVKRSLLLLLYELVHLHAPLIVSAFASVIMTP